MLQFDAAAPLFRLKQLDMPPQDRHGLVRVHWKIGNITLHKNHYTRLDQCYMLWSLLLAMMFVAAQFFQISWTTQAIVWSLLSLGLTGLMATLTWYWSSVEELCWLVWTWVGLMVAGLMITDYSIFMQWGLGIGHLCHLWLGISAIGYWATGWGLQSRAFLLIGCLHALSCLVLPYVLSWQFLFTGLIMAVSLFVLGEYHWDMRSPKELKQVHSA